MPRNALQRQLTSSSRPLVERKQINHQYLHVKADRRLICFNHFLDLQEIEQNPQQAQPLLRPLTSRLRLRLHTASED